MQTYYESVDTAVAEKRIYNELNAIGILKDISINIILPYLEEEKFYKEIHSFKVLPREAGYELNNMIDYYCPNTLLTCAKRSVMISSIFCWIGYIVTHVAYNALILTWLLILISFKLLGASLIIGLWTIFMLWCILLWFIIWLYYGCRYILCMDVNLENFNSIYQNLNCYTFFNNIRKIIWSRLTSKQIPYFLIGNIFCNSRLWCIYYREEDQWYFNRNICREMGDFLCICGLNNTRRYKLGHDHYMKWGFKDAKYLKNLPPENNVIRNSYMYIDNENDYVTIHV